jgi:hypothetical protein
MSADPGKSIVEPSAEAASQEGLSGFSMDFLPVFDGREGEVNTLYCRPTARSADGTVVADTDLLALGMSATVPRPRLTVRAMLHTMDMAAARAGLMVNAGDPRKLIVPVNGVALARKDIASALTERCREFGRDVAQTLIFEVTNTETGASLGVLDEIAIILYPFCLTYSARILPKAQDLKLYASCNYAGVALHMKDKPWPMKAVGGYFDDFTARTEAQRLKAYCHGLGTPALVEAALSAGVRFVSGPGVGPWLAARR